MKIIVTGATGFIGGEILQEAAADPNITEVFTLTRKPLPDALASLSKVTGIIHKDFSNYPQNVLAQLEGAEACIWTIGVARPAGDPRPVDIGCTQAASTAFERHLQPHLSPGKKFRFIHTSGILSEKDQSKTLWTNTAGRLSRGASETAIMDFAKDHEATYEGFVVRPGLVLRRGSWVAKPWMAMTKNLCIPVLWLSLAMLEIAKKGGESRIIENSELIEIGKGLAERNESG
ncbi:hypothetical protein CC78DRAFT_537158 [Lojkania enalia]|uniref:NAD(P)-binding domain-containing protein n=1 Tax=Lojkania enalia TaxID=147567 RepID=A0A9P4MYL5_9PLEO|nr:hypothetical protein CC78DRAFT_537158 [Didymosphaeria enalia]